MKLKQMAVLLFLIFVVLNVVSAKPKLAVLDAIVHSEGKKSVIVPVTESVIEALVSSGKYTVLDRAHVTKVFEEQNFQLSGVVKSEEIKKLGNYLGADIIVVVNVSIIEDIYFISSKMIDVESGEITNQASDKQRGDISVIFDIAFSVGSKLAGTPLSVDTHEDISYTEDPELENVAFGEVSYIDYEFGSDDTIIFNIYDAVVSGMKDKNIHTEFWIGQNNALIPGTKVSLEPFEVIYDPSYWNGKAFWFSYPIADIRSYLDTSKSYYGVFYIIDTATDGVIFSKEIDFVLPENYSYLTEYYDYPPAVTRDFYSRIIGSYTIPVLFGNVYDLLEEILADSTLYYPDVQPVFIDIHLLQAIEDIYFSLFMGINFGDLQEDGESIDFEFVSQLNLQAGMGFLYSMTEYIQSYVGLRAGLAVLALGESWDSFGLAGQVQNGFSLAFETGIDLVIAKSTTISVRGDYNISFFEPDSYDPEAIFPDIAWGTMEEDSVIFDLSYLGIAIGVGFTY